MKLKVQQHHQLKGERNNAPRLPLLIGDYLYVIYVYDKKGFVESRLQCFRKDDFTPVWDYIHPHVINNLVHSADGRLLASCMNGKMYCINPLTGSRDWTFETGTSNIGAVSHPVTSNIVFSGIQSNSTLTYCLDAATGTLNWEQPSNGHSYTPLIDDGYVYNCIGHELSCLRLADGKTVWTASEPESYVFNPKMVNGLVVVSAHGRVNFHEPASGKNLWSIVHDNRHYIRELLSEDDRLFFGDDSGDFYSYRLTANGPELLWKTATGGSIASVPAIHGEHIFVTNDAQKLIALAVTSGEPVAQLSIKGKAGISGITIENERLFFSCHGGHLYQCAVVS